MSNIIKGHNKKSSRKHMTKDQNAIAEKKAECPIEGNCQVNNVYYFMQEQIKYYCLMIVKT